MSCQTATMTDSGPSSAHIRLVCALDSFKGTISSARAAELVERAARVHFPDVDSTRIPVADGGEGTVAAAVCATGGELVSCVVHDPLGRPIKASWGLLSGGRAIVEMAAASGLTLLASADRDPLAASTFGTGELIESALDHGVSDLTLAVGGSATNDCGMGCMRALGVRYLDKDGSELQGTGADLERVCTIDASGLDPRIGSVAFRVLCDVESPLMGPAGCAHIFAPQKGATPAVVERLDCGMSSLVSVLEASYPSRAVDFPGAGAAGGLAAAACLFLDAQVVSGADWVLDLVGLDEALEVADLCITGEGHADAQSCLGKVVSKIAARCKAHSVPCVAIVGGMEPGALALLGHGLTAIVPAVIDACDLACALENAERNFALAADRVFSLLRTGIELGRRV